MKGKPKNLNVGGFAVNGVWNPAEENNARTAIDDHQTWDAVMVVKGTGKLNQRFKKTVKLKGDTVGEIEEWLPVDCVTCKVIALRAGPVAIGTS